MSPEDAIKKALTAYMDMDPKSLENMSFRIIQELKAAGFQITKIREKAKFEK